jgi:hypothetical protein
MTVNAICTTPPQAVLNSCAFNYPVGVIAELHDGLHTSNNKKRNTHHILDEIRMCQTRGAL